MIYPATLLVASLFVVAMMMIWVVPKITTIFVSSDQELPFITRIMIGLSEFTQNYGLFIAGFIVLSIIVLLWLLRDPERKQRWHAMMLNLPWLGRWTKMANIADWSRSLGCIAGQRCSGISGLKDFFYGCKQSVSAWKNGSSDREYASWQ